MRRAPDVPIILGSPVSSAHVVCLDSNLQAGTHSYIMALPVMVTALQVIVFTVLLAVQEVTSDDVRLLRPSVGRVRTDRHLHHHPGG